MHDPRLSNALRQLADLGHAPAPRWCWDIVGLERIGRIRLPASARGVLAPTPSGIYDVRGHTILGALVLRTHGPGAEVPVDRPGPGVRAGLAASGQCRYRGAARRGLDEEYGGQALVTFVLDTAEAAG